MNAQSFNNLSFASKVKVSLTVVTLIGIVFLGTYFRLHDPSERTFWGDEAWRAQQILHASSYQSLLVGKYFGIEMPVQLGEYFLGKGGLALFGKGELAFRFWSIAASILALGLFALLSFRYLSGVLALIALWTVAVSAGMIEHAYEFKPYAVETFLFLFLATVFTSKKLSSSSRIHLLGFGYCAATIFGSVWIFTAFIPLFLFSEAKKSDWMSKVSLAVYFIGSAVGIYSFLSYKALVTERGVTAFWSPYTLSTQQKIISSLTQSMPETLDWYLLLPLQKLGAFPTEPLIAALFIGALLGLLIKPNDRLHLFVFFPFIVMSLLSLLGEYPFFMRVSAFYYTVFLLGALYGFEAFFKGLVIGERNREEPLHQLIFTVLILFTAGLLALAPHGVEDGKARRDINIHPMLEAIEGVPRGPEQTAANYQAQLALAFYRPEWIFEKKVTGLSTPRVSEESTICRYLEELTQEEKKRFLFALDRVASRNHFAECCERSTVCSVLNALNQPRAYLFEMTSP